MASWKVWGAGPIPSFREMAQAGPGPPWETRVMGTAESSQTTRRHWGHRELLRDTTWNPGLTDAVRKSCTRDLSLHGARGPGYQLLTSFLALAIGTSHP